MKLPPAPKSFLHWGEWNIDGITVKVHSPKFAQIYYEKFEVNADRHFKNVSLWFFEKYNGITLESKVEDALLTLKTKLAAENVVIAQCRVLSNRMTTK